MNRLTMAFGKSLKKIRKEKGLTQEKLSEMIGINQRQLTRIEAGKSFISGDTLEKLYFALGVSFSEMFDFELEEMEMLFTGTDNIAVFKAVKSGNLIKLENMNNTQGNLSNEPLENLNIDQVELSALNISKAINKPVTIKYVDENESEVYKVETYFPDGRVKPMKSEEGRKLEEDLRMILDNLDAFGQNHRKIEFVKLAIQSLDNRESLSKLKNMIEGIELALK